MKKLKVLVSIFLVTSIIACAGREAYPIECVRASDREMSCESLADEMKELEGRMNKIAGKTKKTGRNVACAAGSVIFLPALCFMDLKNADKTEYEALKARYNHLSRLYKEKSCEACKTKK